MPQASHTTETVISETPKAELHAHTTFSDGELTPEQLVAEAQRAGLAALAVTDHDIINGVAPARAAAADIDLEIISGVEFSSNLGGHELHLLGLFIDDESEELVATTRQSRDFRLERAVDIIARLATLDIHIELASVKDIAAGGSLGRPHIARALVQHGAASSLDDAFQRYIGVGRPAFTPKPTVDISDIINVVHRAGGVAILAHPASSRVRDEQIFELAEMGLDGFEIHHPKHRPSARRKLQDLIDKLGLLPSGGSDFHGPNSGRSKLGQHAVSVEWMEALRRSAAGYGDENVSTKEKT